MWQPLGEVVPEFDRWLAFPNDPGNASLFRIQFIADGNTENIFSRCWFRRLWTPGLFREKEVEPSQRLYPQPHSLILWLPIPEPLSLAGISPYGYEIKKQYWSRRGVYAEPNWYVSVDFWEAETSNSIALQLQEINLKLNQVSEVSNDTFEDLEEVNQELDRLIEIIEN